MDFNENNHILTGKQVCVQNQGLSKVQLNVFIIHDQFTQPSASTLFWRKKMWKLYTKFYNELPVSQGYTKICKACILTPKSRLSDMHRWLPHLTYIMQGEGEQVGSPGRMTWYAHIIDGIKNINEHRL